MYTYDTLIADLQAITSDNDAEFVAELPAIIRRAEERMLRDLNFELFETIIDTLSTTANSREVILPPEVVMTSSLWFRASPPPPEGDPPGPETRHHLVEERGYAYCLDYAPDEVLDLGLPKYYCEQLAVPPPPAEITGFMVRTISSGAFPVDMSDLAQVGLSGFDGEPNFFVTEPTFETLYPEWEDWEISPVVEGDAFEDMYVFLGTGESDIVASFTARVFGAAVSEWSAIATGDLVLGSVVPSGNDATVEFTVTFADVFVLMSGTVVLTATVGSETLSATLHVNANQFGV